MAEDDDPAEAMARLEAALERIALVARQPAAALHHGGDSAPDVDRPQVAAADADTASLAARLDALIAQLRSAVGQQPG